MIKVLTIKQPYADLILSGIKTLEIRSWETPYRGRLYIHSSKSPNIISKYCGYLLGYIDLLNIRPMQYSDKKMACIDYMPNAFAWVLSSPKKIQPISLKGQLGIFGMNLKEAVNLL